MEMKLKDKVGALDNCVGSIDGKVLEIDRPDDATLQRVVYNGHKRKHALKQYKLPMACSTMCMAPWREDSATGRCTNGKVSTCSWRTSY